MRKNLILSLILGLVLLVSCNEDKIEQTAQTPFNQPNSEVRVYSEEEAKYVFLEPTEDTIVFSADTPEDVLPQVGSIIQMPISDHTPYGFLGRVVSIEKDDNIIVTTEMVPLEEAYPNLSLDADLTNVSNILGLFDEDGNPVEYYIEDIEEDSSYQYGEESNIRKVKKDDKDEYTKITEFDWKKKKLKIPIPRTWVEYFTDEKIDVKGIVELSFEGSDIKVDNNNNEGRYIDIDIRPRVTLGGNVKGHIKSVDTPGKKYGKKTWETPKLMFQASVKAGPVIFPITIPISLKAQLEGDFSTSVELRYNKSWRFHRVYKNGHWFEPEYDTPPVSKENPWYVTDFEASGKFGVGPNIQFNIGLYTNKMGIGVEFFPKAYLKTDAKLSSLDIFAFNPEVEVGVGMEWRIYCHAELFGKKIEPFNIKLPEIAFVKRTLSLFPKMSEFEAKASSSTSADISWQSDTYYFLEPLDVKTGTKLFRPDGTENEYYPNPTSTDRKGQRHYYMTVSDLSPGTSYAVAPAIKWGLWTWYGELQNIQTEANYHLGFRCANRTYDVIGFDFPLNNTTGNVLDYTTEASDYSGEQMRVHITATYNSTSQTLDGVFDFYFYNYPGQRRKDGFSVSLANDDSGYVDCNKIIDNDGCYAAVRIYKIGTSAANKLFTTPLDDDNCNVGICNENYKR